MGSTDAIHLYETGAAGWSEAQPFQVLEPQAGHGGSGFGGSLLWAPQWHSPYDGALLAGVKHAEDGAGVVYAWPWEDGSFGEPKILRAEGYTSFGMSLMALGDVDGDRLEDYAVGIPETIEGESQPGGIVLYR